MAGFSGQNRNRNKRGKIMTKLISEKIERVYDMFETSFIQGGDEIILNKKWNIYFYYMM